MKKVGLKSIRKYLYLLLADFTMGVGIIIISLLFADTAYSFIFSYAEVYIILGVPSYLLLRGILSRILLQQIWLPNLLFFAEVWFGLPIISGEFRFDLLFSIEGFCLAIVFFVIPTIGSLITSGVLRLIRLLKKNQEGQGSVCKENTGDC